MRTDLPAETKHILLRGKRPLPHVDLSAADHEGVLGACYAELPIGGRYWLTSGGTRRLVAVSRGSIL